MTISDVVTQYYYFVRSNNKVTKMDWMDFFFGMYIGISISEAEYEENLRTEIDNYIDEDEYEQFLFDRKLLNHLK